MFNNHVFLLFQNKMVLVLVDMVAVVYIQIPVKTVVDFLPYLYCVGDLFAMGGGDVAYPGPTPGYNDNQPHREGQQQPRGGKYHPPILVVGPDILGNARLLDPPLCAIENLRALLKALPPSVCVPGG